MVIARSRVFEVERLGDDVSRNIRNDRLVRTFGNVYADVKHESASEVKIE